MQALHVSSLIQIRSNLLPVFGTKLADKLGQIEVFLGVPVAFGVLWLLSQRIILISHNVVGFLGCHIQVGPVLLVELHLLHVVIALRQRSLFVGTLLGCLFDGRVRRLVRSERAAVQSLLMWRLN